MGFSGGVYRCFCPLSADDAQNHHAGRCRVVPDGLSYRRYIAPARLSNIYAFLPRAGRDLAATAHHQRQCLIDTFGFPETDARRFCQLIHGGDSLDGFPIQDDLTCPFGTDAA